jgi:hypothetical protein
MWKCPTVVDGAVTVVRDLPDGVEITVTSQKPEAVAAIRERAGYISDPAKAKAAEPQHTSGGGLGRCPIVTNKTKVEPSDVPGGSKFVVKPLDATKLSDLREAVQHRLAGLKR